MGHRSFEKYSQLKNNNTALFDYFICSLHLALLFIEFATFRDSHHDLPALTNPFEISSINNDAERHVVIKYAHVAPKPSRELAAFIMVTSLQCGLTTTALEKTLFEIFETRAEFFHCLISIQRKLSTLRSTGVIVQGDTAWSNLLRLEQYLLISGKRNAAAV